MKLKTAALLTVLIISQVAGTLPVSAESSNTPASQEAVSGAEVTTQANPSSGVQTTEEQPQGGQTDATTDQAVASEVVEGEGEENQPGTENQGERIPLAQATRTAREIRRQRNLPHPRQPEILTNSFFILTVQKWFTGERPITRRSRCRSRRASLMFRSGRL